MPNYENSKIYKISNDVNDDIYVGSTTQKLHQRMKGHRQTSKETICRHNSKFYQLVRELGLEHFKIVLIEDYPCGNKEQLLAREDHFIILLKPQLNMTNAVLNEQKKIDRVKKYNKEICVKNKDSRKAYITEYRKNNKEKIAQHRREYESLPENREKIRAREKRYRDALKTNQI
jgi:hypothetical protein